MLGMVSLHIFRGQQIFSFFSVHFFQNSFRTFMAMRQYLEIDETKRGKWLPVKVGK